MPKFRHQLTEILGQDPAEFLNSSDASATSDQVRQLVEQSLALIDKSEQKLQNRKKLSRQIKRHAWCCVPRMRRR